MSKSGLLSSKLKSGATVVTEENSYREPILWLPLSCLGFNIATGGGVPYGRLLEYMGEYSSGKSLAGYDALAQTQKLGGLAVLVDAEMTFDADFGTKLGIDCSELIIYPGEIKEKDEAKFKVAEIKARSVEKISAFVEDVICKVRSICPMPLPVTIVVDSITAMTTLKQSEGDMDDLNRDLTKAQALGIMYNRVVGIAKKQNVSVIYINQMRDKIETGNVNPYADKSKSTGGKGLEFFATQRIKFAKAGYSDEKQNIKSGMIVDHNGIKLGMISRIEVVKNKVYPPYNKGEVRIDFDRFTGNYGFDKYFGIVDFLVNERVIEVKGSWYLYGDVKLGQGKGKAQQMLEDNPEMLAEIFKKLNIQHT